MRDDTLLGDTRVKSIKVTVMSKKGQFFSGKIGVTSPVVVPGDTNPVTPLKLCIIKLFHFIVLFSWLVPRSIHMFVYYARCVSVCTRFHD